MTIYTPRFIAFAQETYHQQKNDIDRWQHSGDPTLSSLCRDIADAAAQGGGQK